MGKKKGNKLFGVNLDPAKTTVPDFLELWLNELEKKGIPNHGDNNICS